ncbi:MAG: type secretion system lipoprotein TssJ [Deltaproteobacteria bacterium]|nr:type secretion system lipoprotein TssJ [Deltaproteobacteria bacterium]
MNGNDTSDTKSARIRRERFGFRKSAFVALSMVLFAFILSSLSCSSSNKAQGGGQDKGSQAASQPAPIAKSGPQPEQNEKLTNLGLNPSRPYAAKAIQIQYRADENLNRYEDKPHTLTLVVYQVTDIKWFNNNIKDAAGLATLLSAEKPDQSVLAADRFFIEPGEVNQIELDRYENAKWVGIVAGYYDLTPGQVTRSYEMPVLFETKGTFFKTNQAKMGLLGMNLYFGPGSIQEVPNP